MIREALSRLRDRVNNEELILLCYEYLGLICTYIDKEMQERLALEIDSIQEVVIGDKNDFKNGVWYIGGLNNNVFISILLLLSNLHEHKENEVIQDEFMRVAYERCMAILVSESFNDSKQVKKYIGKRIEYYYTWENRYAFAEDYFKRLERHYNKVCNNDLVRSFFRKDFLTSYFDNLSEEEKTHLTLFLVRINKFALAYNQDNVDYQAQRNFYYAWGDIQYMEKERKIKPDNFYNEQMML